MTAREGALNNAEWCDAFCRSHGIVGRFDGDAWVSAVRTPPFYPDAVTLVPGCSEQELLARIDAGPGCSVKDSFADLDLGPFGFDVLFRADWLRLDEPAAAPEGWSTVVDGPGLARWEDAWGEAPGPRPFFRRELLDDERIAVLARREGGELRGGAVANRSATVIGLSNVFGAGWRDAAGAARAALGPLPIVGYDTDAAGLERAGALVVWLLAA